MPTPKPRVRVPKTAKPGEIIEIKALISHRMESGQRRDRKTGERVPRKIINRFEAMFNGQPVFSMDLEPAVSANPFIKFFVTMRESGSFRFIWTDDDGTQYSTTKSIVVEG